MCTVDSLQVWDKVITFWAPLEIGRLHVPGFFFFHCVLRWSVAVSTMRRQSSRTAAFLQADARPMFRWPRCASTARSQVWLGLPNGRFQPGGSPRITAATAWWWSSCGELRAICPKSRKRLSVTRWERGWHLMVAHLLWLPHMVSSGSCIVPTCQMHQCESTGALWWTIPCTHTTRQGLCKSCIQPDDWLPDSFSSKFMQDRTMPIRRRTSPLLPPEESIMLPR